MVSGVRNSCDNLPPKVRRYWVCSLRRAKRRSNPRASAPISSALPDSGMRKQILPSLPTAEAAAACSRPMRKLIQVAKANMMTTAQAVAISVRLNSRVSARSRKASS